MPTHLSNNPSYPPGFWRRIEIHPESNRIVAGLEDDAHCFYLEIEHAYSAITHLHSTTQRAPWSTCPEANTALKSEIVGKRFDQLNTLNPRLQCTHLFDLAQLSIQLATAQRPIRFDMHVADRVNNLTTAKLFKNDEIKLEWQLDGTTITGPERWKGLDLKQLSQWQSSLSQDNKMYARLLRRAVFVSGVRRQTQFFAKAADRGPQRLGACYTYQPLQAVNATPSKEGIIDFSKSPTHIPLENFSFKKF